MAIKVGINENVKLSGAVINEKGTIEISFVQEGQQKSSVAADDLLNQTAEVTEGDGSTKVMLFPPSVEYLGEKREVKQIATDLGGLRDQLQHFLQGYMTSENASLDPYAGIDTTDTAAFQASLTNQNTIDKIYKNLTSQFVDKVNGLSEADRNKLFRLLLVRRSKASHYGGLRKRFISNNPFWEPMTIPASASQVAFNAYEIKNKLNDGTPVSKDEDPADVTDGASAVSSILGTR